MNWDALGAIGEMVGALAVVITLVYLSLQVRQNTKSIEQSRKVELGRAYQERTSRRHSISQTMLMAPGMTEILVKLEQAGFPEDLASIETLTAVEKRKMQSLAAMQLLGAENAAYQSELDLLDDGLAMHNEQFARRMMPAWRALGIVPEDYPYFQDDNEGSA